MSILRTPFLCQTFNFESLDVRTLMIDGQPCFIASDVAAALEYRIAGDMTRNLDADEKGAQIIRTLGGDQEMLVINESGLYSAILRRRRSEARRFKRAARSLVVVQEEVCPSSHRRSAVGPCGSRFPPASLLPVAGRGCAIPFRPSAR